MINGSIFQFLRRKADFFEGFANALPEVQRTWLLNQVVDMRRLLNELEKRRPEYFGRFEVVDNLVNEGKVK